MKILELCAEFLSILRNKSIKMVSAQKEFLS